MKRKLFFLSLAAALLSSQANADIVVEYTTAGGVTSIAANANTNGNVTADDLVAGSGLNVQNFSTFNFSGWDVGSTSFDAAVAANDFWSWGFSVTNPGVTIDLTDMAIRLDRSSSGPDDFEIQASVNGGSPSSVLTFDFMDGASGVTFTGVDLSGLGTVVTGDTVVFTLAAFNSESVNGTFDLETVTSGGTDSIQINGVITKAVPEPTTAAILGIGLVASVVRRRR